MLSVRASWDSSQMKCYLGEHCKLFSARSKLYSMLASAEQNMTLSGLRSSSGQEAELFCPVPAVTRAM